jgi:hypothetical protein
VIIKLEIGVEFFHKFLLKESPHCPHPHRDSPAPIPTGSHRATLPACAPLQSL